MSLDKEDGNVKINPSYADTDDFQKETCFHASKQNQNNVQSNKYNFYKKSGADCITGNEGNSVKGQSFICQKSLGNSQITTNNNLIDTF